VQHGVRRPLEGFGVPDPHHSVADHADVEHGVLPVDVLAASPG
jgi:hypothetical protein